MMQTSKINIIVLYIIIFKLGYTQQISVDNTIDVSQLVENTFYGNCLDISHAASTSNGANVGIGSFGYFQRGTSNFPFEEGLIISTGNANSAGNILNNDVLNDGSDEWLTDEYLETALGITNTKNATSIEFDFISIANTVEFNYIFASEEYFANFPCLYADAFAVLIKEVESNTPYTNIALVPGTNLPVNSNTIHDTIEGFCEEENGSFFEGYNIGDTNFNGRTTVLSAIATIIPNVRYKIKFVIADQTDTNYDSAVFIQANSFNPTVDLGTNINTCADSVFLNGDINNSEASYQWFLDNTPITEANDPAYEVVESGTYKLEINVPLAGSFCSIEDEIVVNLSNTQSSSPISDMIVCDDTSNDDEAVFNLNVKDTEAINSVAAGNYSVSYHTSELDAQNNTNAISGNYTNITNPQSIFVRIEDIDNGCLAFNQFQLQVNALPTITQPQLLEVCDDQIIDGFTTIYLSEVDQEITNGEPNLQVSYHYTEIDANTATNPIAMPYVNDSVNDMVYVSVSDIQTGCISITTLNITVLSPPQLPDIATYYIDGCDPEYDGFTNFDLTSLESEILLGLTNVSTSYHLTVQDAISGTNAIQNPNNFTNTVQTEQVIFIRVTDNNTGCFSIKPIEIHPNLLLSGPDFSSITFCDNDNDGFEPINLNIVTGQILHDIPNVTISFYETDEDRDNGTNELDTSVPYLPPNNPQTLYLTLTSPTCTENEEIILSSLVPIVAITNPGQQLTCDEDQDGLTTIDLTTYESLFAVNASDYMVSFFETETDALNNINQVSNFYNNTTNPFVIYVRNTELVNGCSNISSLEILVNPAPETKTPDPIIICDTDQDGNFTINLENSIVDIVSSTNERIITFFSTQNNAEQGTNPIETPTAYNAETEIVYARVEHTITGCFSTEPITIIVNTIPVIEAITNFKFCENNSDGVGEFLLNTKDSEILNGQTGMNVLYFLTEDDAELGLNAIDKNNIFENTTNPQTIYTRVQNITDNSCYATSSFILEVDTEPLFNEPSDLFLCDDASNDTFVTIDLNDKFTEITNGISGIEDVRFYTSLDDLQDGINPIISNIFTTTSNPQEIYAEIDNGSICKSVTSFVINVTPVPRVTEILPFETCNNDYNNSSIWDLTEAEINILDIRQDNIIVDYFITEIDAENGTNPITNPESFTNTTNPQTVFLRVIDTFFNCPLIIPIHLQVNLPPPLNDFQVYEICDNENNTFQLDTINSVITDNLITTEVTYYTSTEHASNKINALDNNYNYQSLNDIIYARLEDTTTQCYIIYPFVLAVNELPVVNTPPNLEDCDDDFDGRLIFDFSIQDDTILNGLDTSIYEVTYHENQNFAEAGVYAITEPYNTFNNQTIFARVTNIITQCFSLTQFKVFVRPLPILDIGNQTICLNNIPLIVSAETGIKNDTYSWSTGEVTPQIEISDIGTYSVTVTTEYGCSYHTTFDVIESESAEIEVVETVDFSDPNNITITVSGIGDYLFQLNDGLPQTSNSFENVPLGYHLLTIIDQNGCASITKELVVIDAPKFFTPNNDGSFDTWHISGVETLPGTVVHIFDRYGKLLKQLSHLSEGWDGLYNGNLMPTSDYWYTAEVRQNDEAFTVKGHFTLKR